MPPSLAPTTDQPLSLPVSLSRCPHTLPAGQAEGGRARFCLGRYQFGACLICHPPQVPARSAGLSLRSADNAGHESPFSAPLAVGSQALSAASRKEKQKAAKSLSFPPRSLMFWKALWEINIAAGPSSSFPYPQKSPLRPSALINFKIKTDVAGRMIYGLPHTLLFLRNARVWGFFFGLLSTWNYSSYSYF